MKEETKLKKERVWYMWYWYEGKRVRSKEYTSLREFTEKCGAWCDEHPEDYQLCSRIRTVSAM